MARVSDFVFYQNVRRVARTYEERRQGVSEWEPVLPEGYRVDHRGTIWGPDGNIKRAVQAPAPGVDPVQHLRVNGYDVEG